MVRNLMLMLIVLVGLLATDLLRAQEKKPEEITPPKQTAEQKVSPELQAKIEELIKQLGDEDWKVREEAQKELIKIGQTALFPLIDVLDSKDPEVRLRAGNILSQLEPELRDDEVTELKQILKEAKGNTKDILQKLCEKWWIGIEGGTPVNGLQLTIRSDKKAYKLEPLEPKERITIEFRLRNIEKEDFYIRKNNQVHPFDTYEINGPEGLVQPKGRLEEPGAPPPQPTKNDFTLLEKGKGYVGKTLGKFQGNAIVFYASSWDASATWSLSKPGKYQIKMKYQNLNDGKKLGLTAWTGEVVSNTITIEIKEQ